MAQALMSTLPGLDANDPPKTLATLKLYTCVLSSVHRVCDPAEVAEIKWISLAQLQRDLRDNPGNFTPWFRREAEIIGIL